MLQVFYLNVAYILQRLFKCFQTYVASVSVVFTHMLQMFSSRCCKNRSNVAHVAMGSTYRSRLLQLLGRRRSCAWEAEGARETQHGAGAGVRPNDLALALPLIFA
jgi:hypothetical protein